MDQRVQRTVQLMRDSLHKELSLDELAQSVNLSVWRLSHIFKAETGLAPIHYLRFLRMERAGHLLETSFLSVKEIAHAVGINDESHFVRDFKIINGVTPTRYRMLRKDEHQNESPHSNHPQSKIRQQIAKAAKGSILPALTVLTYIVKLPTTGGEACEKLL